MLSVLACLNDYDPKMIPKWCCCHFSGGLLRGMKVTDHVVNESSTSPSSRSFAGSFVILLCVKVQLMKKNIESSKDPPEDSIFFLLLLGKRFSIFQRSVGRYVIFLLFLAYGEKWNSALPKIFTSFSGCEYCVKYIILSRLDKQNFVIYRNHGKDQ